MLQNDMLTSFQAANDLLSQFITDSSNIEKTAQASKTIADCFDKGGKVIIFGNGGSSCDATHFAEEFTGRYRKARKPLPVISINDGGHITCVANDYGFEEVFSRSVEAFAQTNDIVIGLSTSGNSANILKAFEVAKNKSATTIALLGQNGGLIKNFCDLEWIIPGTTSDRIQEIHMLILHVIIEGVERILFPENYQ